MRRFAPWSETQMVTPSDQMPRGSSLAAVEGVLAELFAALEVVGEERVGAAVQHPHRLLVGPDAARIAVLARQLELALLDALPVREAVGEEALAAAVGDPDDTAVGPEAARRPVRLVQRELALGEAFAAVAVVGVDRVAGAVRVVSDPQRRAVRPHAGGPVVAAVEFLDVAVDGPLEVDLARGGATAAAAAAAATATARDDGRRSRNLVDDRD